MLHNLFLKKRLASIKLAAAHIQAFRDVLTLRGKGGFPSDFVFFFEYFLRILNKVASDKVASDKVD